LAADLGFGGAHFRVMCWALGTGDAVYFTLGSVYSLNNIYNKIIII
jgi:hypothetical protein